MRQNLTFTPTPIGQTNQPVKQLVRGFTLIESILVVSILAIIISLSLPLLRKTFNDIQLSDACQNIISLSHYARQKAVVEQIVYRLNFDSKEDKYWLTYKDSQASEFIRSQDRLGKIYFLAEGIDLKSERMFINFYPDGRTEAASFSLANQNGKTFSLVTEPNLGDVKIIKE